MSFVYANPTSGPSAGGIGWFDFGNFVLAPGASYTGLTGTLNNGVVVTFDISSPASSQLAYTAIPPNVGFFGTLEYTGITSNIGLYAPIVPTYTGSTIVISNIVVKDSLGNPVPNYTVILADTESTNDLTGFYTESWNWITNGGPWSLFHTVANWPPTPVITGLGTQNATITGANTGPTPGLVSDHLLATQSPTALTMTSIGHEAVSIGFATTTIKLQKNIGQRVDPTDQFTLNIGGTPSSSATTSGGADGIQSQAASIYAIPQNSYSINEIMAAGSATPLSTYTVVTSSANATPAGSIPPTGTLPIMFSPALGDDVTYTILNAAPAIFTKTVDKAFANVGEILTYTIKVENTNNFPVNNVFVMDATPAGTTYNGNLVVIGSLYTGTTPAGGITLTTIPADSFATVSWQVKVNTTVPIPNPVPNVGEVTVPGLNTGLTDVVTTTVNTAHVTINKIADKAFADIGDTITYTLQIANAGNVAANSVVITDVVPTGTSFVPGSVTGATGIPPTLTLPAPLAAGSSVMVSFKVKVDSTVPVTNPLVNTASVAYTYTVDPANPDGESGSAQSLPVPTQVNNAAIIATKTVDKAFADLGDVVTYTITLQNTGNVPANNVILTDAVPSGSSFVPGSVTGATGTPPTLTLTSSIPAGGTATVTFQVKVDGIPSMNPMLNQATADFTYTVDPAKPDAQSGSATTSTIPTQVNSAIVTTMKQVDKEFATIGDLLTYTLTLKNSGNTSANSVIITDAIPAGTSFVGGSLTGATGTPPTLMLSNPIPAGSAATVTFQVIVGNALPVPNPIPNTALVDFSYTVDPSAPDGVKKTVESNLVNSLVNFASISTTKTVDKSFATAGEILTYTIVVQNSGNTVANNVVLTDTIPVGTSFVPGSVTGATGVPPTLTLTSPVPAGGSITVTFQVKVGLAVPTQNPVVNGVSAAFTFTIDPSKPNGASGTSAISTADTQVNFAKLEMEKHADKSISYIGDIISYQISLKNIGNTNANNVVITDLIPVGTQIVAGSLNVTIPYSGTPTTGLTLVGGIAPGQTVVVSFDLKVLEIPTPNPIENTATATYSYTVDPTKPDEVAANAHSNTTITVIFRYNFGQQISDLIGSVALEEAALAAIANAEGAKIQKMVAMDTISTSELLCLNRSVADMLESLSILESVLKQKLNAVSCQINTDGAGCK